MMLPTFSMVTETPDGWLVGVNSVSLVFGRSVVLPAEWTSFVPKSAPRFCIEYSADCSDGRLVVEGSIFCAVHLAQVSGEYRIDGESEETAVREFESVPVRMLQVGDVVLAHGMVLLVDRAPVESIGHGGAHEDRGGVWYTQAQVLNVDEVREAGFVPVVWLMDNRVDDAPRWTLQGNDWGTVSREIR